MAESAHLWAVAFNGIERADEVRAEIAKLADEKSLVLLDIVLAVRYADGIVTIDGEPFVSPYHFQSNRLAPFLASLALRVPPLTAPVVRATEIAFGGTLSTAGISEDFIQEAQALMKPGTSALFILDQGANLPAILRGIRGLGGTVLKTNVDLDRARLIQSALAADSDKPQDRP